jgi:hypothetical protein
MSEILEYLEAVIQTLHEKMLDLELQLSLTKAEWARTVAKADALRVQMVKTPAELDALPLDELLELQTKLERRSE